MRGEERRGGERERASQRRKVSGARLARSAAAVQWVKSSVLNDAHIDKWMAHPLLLLRLCLPPDRACGLSQMPYDFLYPFHC